MSEKMILNCLRITKPIEVDFLFIDVNEENCETYILKHDDNSISVKYILKESRLEVEKDRVYEHAKEIWQKAQQQQL
jgi:hypothetical protein